MPLLTGPLDLLGARSATAALDRAVATARTARHVDCDRRPMPHTFRTHVFA